MDNQNNIQKKITDPSSVELFAGVIDYIINHDEHAKALDLVRFLEKTVANNTEGLRAQPELDSFYRQAIVKLKYICLPALEDKEIIDLFKNNFLTQFSLTDYDLLKKMNAKLINVIVFEERNIFKKAVLQVILGSTENITDSFEIKMVKDWLKDYVAKVGLDSQDNLARAQYLIDLKNNKKISEQEHYRLSILFKLYEFLNTDSSDPEGFNEEIPVVTKDNKMYIFRKGMLEPVVNNELINGIVSVIENKDVLVNQSTKTTSAALSTDSRDVLGDNYKPVSDTKNNNQNNNRLQEIEKLLSVYPPDSLEYKAVQQEIKNTKAQEKTNNNAKQ